MHVLVVESDRRSADKAILDLRAAGHHVERCHEVDLPAFPCNALCDKGTCPLESKDGIDVVLDYRSRPHPWPTAYEDGVSCSLRRYIPLVVAGTSALNPFDKWTTAIATDDELVETCERAAAQTIERLAEPARIEVRRRLRLQPRMAERSNVVVHRSHGQLKVTISLPVEADDLDGALAVAVAGVLRGLDHNASRVNIAVERTPTQGWGQRP